MFLILCLTVTYVLYWTIINKTGLFFQIIITYICIQNKIIMKINLFIITLIILGLIIKSRWEWYVINKLKIL